MLHPNSWIHRTSRRLGIALAAASLAAIAAAAAARPADGPCQAEKQLNVAARMRDGVTLYADVYRPKLAGSYPVILMRLPYNKDAAQTYVYAPPEFYASHCYIVVIQDVRGQYTSEGSFYAFRDEAKDGYDTIEWAARLPGANGKVGMIGHSDEGRLVWFAAVSNPPHLAAISPTAATPDPWVVVPYAAMAFGPINVDWACLMRGRTMATNTAELDIGEAIRHLPLATLPQRLGCGDVPLWDRWVAHPTLDAYWRAHAATTYIANMRAPVLSMAGWHDDSRGPTYYTDFLLRQPNHPNWHFVMNPGAHKGVDYVAGDFGPQARYAYRDLQLRWFDHYLLGKNNGVDTLPHIDDFVMGDNVWRQENEWPLARQHLTKFYIASDGHAQTSNGDGALDSVPPAAGTAAADTFTYDPADPTPYLIDSRELEESLNEDYTLLNATRRDALVFTSAPLTRPLEVTGEMTARVWAATDRHDTDWTIMLLDVFPDGHAERVQDGLVRARFRNSMSRPVPVVPGRAYAYDIDVWFTSMVFQAGHRLRVSIASALFPKYDRNLNTNGNYERDTTFVVAHQRVLHDAAHPTHITLPVIPR